MSNVAFYIDTVNSDERNVHIFEKLNEALLTNKVDDAIVFFNNVEFNPVVPKFGMFNAAEMWSFTGTLLCTSLENSLLARNVVNKFRLLHLYNKEIDNDLINLLRVSENIEIITENEEDSKEYFRLTGKKPVCEAKDLDIETILEAV